MPEKLPKGWVKATLGEIRLDASVGISQRQMRGETFELYSVPSFDKREPEIVPGDTIGSNKVLVAQGDVLLCKINPRINRAWIVAKSSGHQQIASTEWIVFSKQEGISSELLVYFFSQDSFRDYLATNVSGVGGSLMRVNARVVEAYSIPLAPTREQERIVAKLEAQLSRLTAGEAAARRAQERLQRYRAAVLHSAVTGELTRNWRKVQQKRENENPETGDDVLARLLASRRKRWEESKALRIRGKGKKSDNGNPKSRYAEPAKPKIDNLSELPKNWTWISIEQLSWASGYGTSVKCTYDAQGPAVLRIPNIQNGNLNFENLKFAANSQDFDDKDYVAPGDMLLVRTNGSKNLIGRAAVIKTVSEHKYSFASYLIRFRLLGNKTLLSWVSLTWDSDVLRANIEARAATTAGQYNISLSGLADLAIPLPPTAEQIEIIREVDRRLLAADRLAGTLERQLDRARATRQSLLHDAFIGRLVPQNHKDESASALLERIGAARKSDIHNLKGKRMQTPISKTKTSRRLLLDVLREHKKPMTPEKLFMDSGYQQEFERDEFRQEVIDKFYEELRELVGPKGQVLEKRPNLNTVLLEIKS